MEKDNTQSGHMWPKLMAEVARPQFWGRKFEQRLVAFLSGEDAGQCSRRPRQLEFGNENTRKKGAM